jgi:DNA-binding NtrC family response regulator
MSRVLVVDDEPAVCWSMQELLSDRGHTVQTSSSVEQAWERLGTFSPDAVVLDVRLPGADGLTALPEFRRRCPDAPVIVITAFGDLSTAVTALGRGAFDYLVKPFELRQFVDVVERALAPPPPTPQRATSAEKFIGRSRVMQAVFRQIALVAPTGFPVLVVGETGTGKEVAARAIHQNSPRAAGPFVAVCPAALNPAVIESELFGHVRGAFTGAAENRMGLFELAENGTLFLDEIADTPLAVQVKLLRVLETGRFCPVGTGVERSTNARLIAATHRNLHEMIQAGTFREDLYHRLKVFMVKLPALRDRPEDLRPLVEHFFEQLASDLQPSSTSDDFWLAVERRDWPGNVRELRHAIDYAAVLARGGSLRADHLPHAEGGVSTANGSPDQQIIDAVSRWAQGQLQAVEQPAGELHRKLLELVESGLLREVLVATQQNRTAAAKLLGMDRATLRTRLRQLFGEDSDRGDRP